VFLAAAVVGYFLIPPTVFYGWYILLGAAFIIAFALTTMCIVRNVKERAVLKKAAGGSIVGAIAAAIGLAALEMCGIGAPVCGATLGLGVLSALIPSFAMGFFESYGAWIAAGTIALQLVALHFMNCFKGMGQTIN